MESNKGKHKKNITLLYSVLAIMCTTVNADAGSIELYAYGDMSRNQDNYPWTREELTYFEYEGYSGAITNPEHGHVTVQSDQNGQRVDAVGQLAEGSSSMLTAFSAVDGDGLHASATATVDSQFTGVTFVTQVYSEAEAIYTFDYYAQDTTETSFTFHLDGVLEGFFDDGNGNDMSSSLEISFSQSDRRGNNHLDFFDDYSFTSDTTLGEISTDLTLTIEVNPNTWNTLEIDMYAWVYANMVTDGSIMMQADFANTLSLTGVTSGTGTGIIYVDEEDFFAQTLGAPTLTPGMEPGAADPVPEPATALLFGTGLACVVGSRIRRKK